MAQLSTPYSFIAMCLSTAGEHRVTAFRNEMRDPRWNWEAVIQTAASEGVLPTLNGRMQQLRITPDLPAEIADFFETVEQLSLERNRKILNEVVRVSKLLNGAGIEPTLLKGVAYLTSGVYPDISARFLADIDLLIPTDELDAAVEVLKRSDFKQLYPSPSVVRLHYPALQREEGIEIELHRSLGVGKCDLILPASEVLGLARLVEFEGARIRVPIPEHLIVHHISHSQIQDTFRSGLDNRVWSPLRVMYDLVRLQDHFGSEVDWKAIETRFRKHGQADVLATTLLLAEDVLDMRRPIPVRLSGWTALRWFRIKALRAAPGLRRIDPISVFFLGVIPYARRLRREVLDRLTRLRRLFKKPNLDSGYSL